ncbi:Hypothetical predicted protein [Paramuricea clavata]|uniref:Uncharacterized protein n=1 Tax=Paramuricea clavata TaxID=317549 RepID=A0A6S7FKU3_PARCT|nr:Hypothetical predicted protein [Paramuricea clavata]
MSRTYYFESAATLFEPLKWNAVIKAFQDLGMRYYKYLRYELQQSTKIVCVVQFTNRINNTQLHAALIPVKFTFLQRVRVPMVTPHLRIWLLCLHHDLPEYEIKEWGEFVLGGRNRFLTYELQHYKALISNFKTTKDYTLCEHFVGGRKICEYADALERLPVDGV